MVANPSTGSTARSRRSACDRCRAYKLRCQRDEQPNEPCDRCLKAHLVCTTTFDQASQRPNGGGGGHLHNGNERGARMENNGNLEPRLPSPDWSNSPPEHPSRRDSGYDSRLPSVILPSPAQGEFTRDTVVPSALEDMRRNGINRPIMSTARRVAEDTADTMPLDQESLDIDGMDFSMPDMAFDSNDLSLLIVDYPVDHNKSLSRAMERGRQGDGEDAGRRFSYEDFSTTGTASTSVPSWPTTHAGFSEGSMESGRDQETDAPPTVAEEPPHDPTKSHKDLLRLSLELMEDQQMMDMKAPWPPKPPLTPNPLKCSSSIQQQPVNRMLDQASRLWDILKSLSAASEVQKPHPGARYENGTSNRVNGSSNGNGQGSVRPRSADLGYMANGDMDSRSFLPTVSSQSAKGPDPLLSAHLVTTYVCLIRTCRAVFARLYHALLMAPTSEVNSLISLPGLQFGNFPLENNLAIQVRVLIELTSGMLLRISNALGINPASIMGGSSSPKPNEESEHRLPFISDPVAISIREIILSQEMMQSGAQNGEPPPLGRIIKNIQTLLERRYINI